MDFSTFVKAELERLNRKIDRLTDMISRLPMSHQTDLGDWLSEEQAQELLHRGATSLWGLRKRRIIKSTKLEGRTYYSRQSIIDYMEKHKD